MYVVHMATDTPRVGDPDDPTTVRYEDGRVIPVSDLCAFDFPGPTMCTRPQGHSGLHAFGDGIVIREVWA